MCVCMCEHARVCAASIIRVSVRLSVCFCNPLQHTGAAKVSLKDRLADVVTALTGPLLKFTLMLRSTRYNTLPDRIHVSELACGIHYRAIKLFLITYTRCLCRIADILVV